VDGEFFESEPQLMIRLAVRGFANGVLQFEERMDMDEAHLDELIPQLAEKHVEALRKHRLHMVEIEFLDERNPLARFHRLGTDPSGMIMPLKVKLPEENIN
jgi:hypothetical protein